MKIHQRDAFVLLNTSPSSSFTYLEPFPCLPLSFIILFRVVDLVANIDPFKIREVGCPSLISPEPTTL